MTKFADQLFDDLMREHGTVLSDVRVPSAPRRRHTARPALLAAGAGGVAAAVTAGLLVAGGRTPAYAVTRNPDGTVSLAVYQQSGIAGANAKLHQRTKTCFLDVFVSHFCMPRTEFQCDERSIGR